MLNDIFSCFIHWRRRFVVLAFTTTLAAKSLGPDGISPVTGHNMGWPKAPLIGGAGYSWISIVLGGKEKTWRIENKIMECKFNT